MGETNGREIVYDMLLEFDHGSTNSTAVHIGMLKKYAYLEKRERAFISRVFRGVLENRIYLDYVIDKYSSTPCDKLKRQMKNILEIGSYQILMLDQVPDGAAVNEAVNMAKSHGFGKLSGFTNGVLRTIAREKAAIELPDSFADPAQYISVKYSLPLWLTDMWLDEYGMEEVSKMGEFMLRERPVSLRVRNPERMDKIQGAMMAQGITVEPGNIFPDVIKAAGFDTLMSIKSFVEGELVVQDESSMIPVAAAGIKPGDSVLDICAAPGGKTIQTADRLGGSGSICARDISHSRARRIEENAERTGLTDIRIELRDALEYFEEDEEAYDVVLADLPCSGLGVIGRKPDIKTAASPEKITALAGLQKLILSNAWHYVKHGGILIYSTCTLTKEENEENAAWLLKNFPLEAVSMDDELPDILKNEDTAHGILKVMPGEFDSDGFFICKVRRK